MTSLGGKQPLFNSHPPECASEERQDTLQLLSNKKDALVKEHARMPLDCTTEARKLRSREVELKIGEIDAALAVHYTDVTQKAVLATDSGSVAPVTGMFFLRQVQSKIESPVLRIRGIRASFSTIWAIGFWWLSGRRIRFLEALLVRISHPVWPRQRSSFLLSSSPSRRSSSRSTKRTAPRSASATPPTTRSRPRSTTKARPPGLAWTRATTSVRWSARPAGPRTGRARSERMITRR